MKTVTASAHLLVRVSGLVLTVLGILFWTGYARSLIPIYVLVGGLLALGLWVLAFAGVRAGASPSLVVPAILLGLLVPSLGLTDDWVLYLVGGPGAIGTAEGLMSRVQARRALATQTDPWNGVAQ